MSEFLQKFQSVQKTILINYFLKEKGPYAKLNLIQPGDFLYYINHSYEDIEHSAIFVDWVDSQNKQALMLSYGGESRQEPARYLPYDLSHVYRIVRATN
ncbi:conserved hypothetical protein [Beggiatoa sp. PS]|nr:conserved hypothetical protein [Beggiatoa sp. PS]